MQLMNSATYIIGNSSSCFDLLFTQQSNLVTSSGAHTLHNNFHHQMTFLHINLPIEYYRLIWDYSNADILNIMKSISSINWCHLFSENHTDIQFSTFEEGVSKVFKNFVPNKYVALTTKHLSG